MNPGSGLRTAEYVREHYRTIDEACRTLRNTQRDGEKDAQPKHQPLLQSRLPRTSGTSSGKIEAADSVWDHKSVARLIKQLIRKRNNSSFAKHSRKSDGSPIASTETALEEWAKFLQNTFAPHCNQTWSRCTPSRAFSKRNVFR